MSSKVGYVNVRGVGPDSMKTQVFMVDESGNEILIPSVLAMKLDIRPEGLIKCRIDVLPGTFDFVNLAGLFYQRRRWYYDLRWFIVKHWRRIVEGR